MLKLPTRSTASGKRRAAARNSNTASPLTTSLDPLMKEGSDRPFRDLIYGLIRLSNLMRSNQEHFARYIDVSVPQYVMLSVLEDTSEAPVSQIASHLEVSSQFVTLETGKLIDKGLVEKRPNEEDRRSVLLKLTPAGKTLMRELAPLRRQTNDLMFRSLSAEQAAELRDILGTLLEEGRDANHQLDAPHRRDERAPSVREGARPRHKAFASSRAKREC